MSITNGYYSKSPAVRPPDGRARTHRRAVIARVSLYEQGGRQPGLRIQAAMAGAAKQRSHRLLYMVKKCLHLMKSSVMIISTPQETR